MHGRTPTQSHKPTPPLHRESHPSHHLALPFAHKLSAKLSYSMTGACKSRETATLYLQQLTQARGGKLEKEEGEREGEDWVWLQAEP